MSWRYPRAKLLGGAMCRIKDTESGYLSEPISVSDWKTSKWDRSASGEADGTILTGELCLHDIASPGAAYLLYVGPAATKPEEAEKQLSRVAP